MADEFRHESTACGTSIAQTDWEDTDIHQFDSQAQGDIMYASSATQLSRLGAGTAGMFLQTNGGAANPAWSQTFPDDFAVIFGAGGDAQILYETADADALALVIGLPQASEDASNVPVAVFGDLDIVNVDLGFFDGRTMPAVAVINIARDAYVTLDSGDDAVAGSKGLAFYAAGDEDIEILNLTNTTGTPRIFWDESEDRWSSNFGLRCTVGVFAFTNTILKDGVVEVQVRNYADTGYLGLRCAATNLHGDINMAGGGLSLVGSLGDDQTFYFESRDNTVGAVEIGRMQNAADPYFGIGRDDTGVSVNTITDMLVLQAGAGTNNEAANFGLGISILLGNDASQVEERASIDFVLTAAGDGAEAARMDINLMTGGAMVAGFVSISPSKGLTFATSADSALVADEVTLGGYEIGAGNRVLAISQETAVAVEVDETKFSHKMQCRINGATYYIMLTAT